MKVSSEHYKFIVTSLAQLTPSQLERSRQEARSHYIKDLQMNFRWRLFVVANLWEIYKLDPDYTDIHINTALKKAVKDLNIAPA